MATLNAKARHALNDDDFAYIDSKGVRHLPIQDAAHVRAALGGDGFVKQSFESREAKVEAAKKIAAAAKRFGIKIAPDDAVAKLAMAEKAKRHTHARVGGGKLTHSHIGASVGHDHKATATDDAMLPMLRGAVVDDDDDGDMDMAENVGLVAPIFDLEFDDNASEVRVPFLVTGRWEWDDYGVVSVASDDLRTIKQKFDAGARGQDLPVVNEAHDPDRAVGWVKDIIADDPENPSRLEAIVEFNPDQQDLVKNRTYRYVSPELLSWKDPASGEKHPMLAAGLALTNKPRIKQLGSIAASEANSPNMALLGFAEGPVAVSSAADLRRLVMAENDPDNDGDNDGDLPLCMHQPPNEMNGCFGYTRRPGDTDGDGTCAFAEQCNGYRPCMVKQTISISQMGSGSGMSPMGYSEASSNDSATNSPQGVSAMTQEQVTGVQSAPSSESTPAERDLLMEEQKKRADLEVLLAEQKERASALEARLAKIERERTLETIRHKFDEFVATGRMTPAARDKILADEDQAIRLSEIPSFMEEIAERPKNSVVDMQERGSSVETGKTTIREQVIHAAEKVKAENAQISAAKALEKSMLEIGAQAHGEVL